MVYSCGGVNTRRSSVRLLESGLLIFHNYALEQRRGRRVEP